MGNKRNIPVIFAGSGHPIRVEVDEKDTAVDVINRAGADSSEWRLSTDGSASRMLSPNEKIYQTLQDNEPVWATNAPDFGLL